MKRFEKLWQRWDGDIRSGCKPLDIISRLSDETLLEMLGSAGSGEARRYERNLLTTEALNRLNDTRRNVNESTLDASGFMEEIRGSVEEAADEVHETERVVERLTAEQGQPARNAEADQAHEASMEIEKVRSQVESGAEAWDRLRKLRESTLHRARDRGRYEDDDES